MGKFRNPGPFKKIGFSFRTRSEKAGNISLRVDHACMRALSIWSYRMGKEISKHLEGQTYLLILGAIGIICIDYGFYISAWLFQSLVLGLLGLVTGAIGIFLLYWIKNRNKREEEIPPYII